ncbi:hypothetical protein TorRG33x02_027020, partial [Trema orientale]
MAPVTKTSKWPKMVFSGDVALGGDRGWAARLPGGVGGARWRLGWLDGGRGGDCSSST